MTYHLPILTTLIFFNLLYSRNNRDKILLLKNRNLQISYFEISLHFFIYEYKHNYFTSLMILFLKDINLIKLFYCQYSNLKFQKININKFLKILFFKF